MLCNVSQQFDCLQNVGCKYRNSFCKPLKFQLLHLTPYHSICQYSRQNCVNHKITQEAVAPVAICSHSKNSQNIWI